MDVKKIIFNVWVRCYSYNNKYILSNRRRRESSGHKWFYDLLLAMSSLWFIMRWGVFVLYENLYGKTYVHHEMEREKAMAFKHEMAFVTIVKNEGAYIREWIEFHRLVGVTKFYIYDNESNDDTYKLLTPYMESGLVEYKLIAGKARQLDAYNNAVKAHKDECRWMAFLDLDEFLVPMEPYKPIADVVSEIVYGAGKGAAGVSVNWALYGSSHLKEKPQGLVIDNFVNRAMPTHWSCYMVKTVCNPRMIRDYISPHYPLYKLGAYSVNESEGKRQYCWFCHVVAYKRLRVNHYMVKSLPEFMTKRNRGLADRDGSYDMEVFDKYDQNDIHDEMMKIYSTAVKQQLCR